MGGTSGGRVAGKVAFITGGARGQGRSHAVRLAQEGADIVLVDICAPVSPTVNYPPAELSDLEMTAKLVEAEGRRAIARVADVRDRQALEAVALEAVVKFGKIDIVCANAGICSFISALEITQEHWQEMIDVNLTGVWNTLQATVPHMVERDEGGSVIITSSAAGLKGMTHLAHYSAAKHGLVGLMKTFALEFAPNMIRFNTVHPTGVNTLLASDPRVWELMEADEMWAFRNAINPMPVPYVEPSDVTNAVLFLASDESMYVTGHTMTVDAGFQAK